MCLKINWSVKTPWRRPSMRVARSGLWSPDFNTEHLHSLLLFNRLSNCLFLSLRHRRNQTLVKSVCETAPEPCSGSPSVYQGLSTRHDWPDIKAIVDLRMRWREIRNALPVIRWVRWGPKTRILVLFRRRYVPRLHYVCDAGYHFLNPLYLGYHILFCIVPLETTLAFSSLAHPL